MLWREGKPGQSSFEVNGQVILGNLTWVRQIRSKKMGFVAVLRDITQETQAERAKTSFIATVSHELRTPLSSIRVFGEFMRRGRVDDPDKVRIACHAPPVIICGPDVEQRTLGELREAIMEGAVLRVRPKAMTVAVIVAGLLPIFLSEGTGSEVMSRLAAPMVGGLVSSTILTLVIIPAVYDIWKRWELRNTISRLPEETEEEIDEGD